MFQLAGRLRPAFRASWHLRGGKGSNDEFWAAIDASNEKLLVIEQEIETINERFARLPVAGYVKKQLTSQLLLTSMEALGSRCSSKNFVA